MRRRRFIPFVLTIALSTSVYGFSAPTWGEPVTEHGASSGEEGLDLLEGSSSDENVSEGRTEEEANISLPENADLGENLAPAENQNDSLAANEENPEGGSACSDPEGDCGMYPEVEYVPMPDTEEKDEEAFKKQFTGILDPIEISEYLDFVTYFDKNDGSGNILGLTPNNPSSLEIAKAIQKAGIDPDLKEVDGHSITEQIIGKLYNGIPDNIGPTIHFTTFTNGKRLAYAIYSISSLDKPSKYYLVPLVGRKLDNFLFSIMGCLNSFNLSRDKDICKGHRNTIIQYIKRNYPGIEDLRFTNRRVQSELVNGVNEYYYEVEYTDTEGNKKASKLFVNSRENYIRNKSAIQRLIETNVNFSVPEGRFDDNQVLTPEEITELEKQFDRLKENVLTRITSVTVHSDLDKDFKVTHIPLDSFPDEELDKQYGVVLTVGTEDGISYDISMPIRYSRELKVESLFAVNKNDLGKYALSTDKKYIYLPEENSENEGSLEAYLKTKLNSGEKLGEPDILVKNKASYKKEIHYPVLAEDGSIVRTLKLNLRDEGFLSSGNLDHPEFFLKGYDVHYDSISEANKEELKKIFQDKYGEAFEDIIEIGEPDGSRASIKLKLHDGTEKTVHAYILGYFCDDDSRTAAKVPAYNTSGNYSCYDGCEEEEEEEPQTPDQPQNPEEPAQPENPATPSKPGRGNSGGSGSNGGGSRTPILGEDRTPVVLSENRESTASSVNPEVLGEARETAHEEAKPIPEVLGAERKGRGHVKTMDETHAFPLYFSALSAIALAFWALQEKKKSKTGNTL